MRNKKTIKQVVIILLGLLVALGSILPALTTSFAKANSGEYEVVAKSDNVSAGQGQQAILWTTLKNLGTEKWIGWDTMSDTPLRLGTIDPLDRVSQFYTAGNWKSPNRVHWADQAEANTNENMSFGFKISIPANLTPGTYRECFAPLVENVRWLGDKDANGQDLCWNIEVLAGQMQNNDYLAETTGVSFQRLTLAPGDKTQITFTAKNAGLQTWLDENDSSNPVHLATIDPNDKISKLYDQDSWLAVNRPTGLKGGNIVAGATGSFTFMIQAPADAKTGDKMTDKYWLVAEDKNWFPRRADQFFGVEVTIDENAPEQPDEDDNSSHKPSGGGSAGGGSHSNDDEDESNDLQSTVDLKVNENDQTVVVEVNGSASLSWQSTNSKICVASDDWTGNKNANDYLNRETISNITTDQKYTITCSNNSYSASDTVWVKVNQNMPTGSITTSGCNAATNLLNVAGQASDTDHPNTSHEIKFYSSQTKSADSYRGYTWTNAATGNFSFAYSDNSLTNNSQQQIYAYAIDQDTNKEYLIASEENIICQGDEATAPTVDLLLDESDQTKTIVSGDSVNLSWTSTDATACSAEWTSKTSVSGSEDVTPTVDTIYTIHCEGVDELYAEDSVEVKVVNTSLSLASDTPAGTTIPKGTQDQKMTKFKFVGSGTVQNINIAYDGTNIDSIDHVYLYDGNNMLGTGDRDENYFAFEDINWNINNTKYLTVEADFNIDALTDSTHKFGIEDISSVTGLSAIGSFPIWGESFRIGNTTVSTATIAKVGNPSNPSVGEYADLANFSITNGTNDIALNSISLTQDGTIDNADLTNLELWQGTDKLADVGAIIDNKINFNLTTPYQIDSNTSCTLTVKGSASGSANETIKIYLASTTDVNIEDLQYSTGANVINNYEGETNYSEVTLQGASVTLAFNGPATGQINIAQDQTMMNLAITAADRQVDVKKLSFLLTGDNLETEDTKLFSQIKIRETDSAYSQDNGMLMGPQPLCDDGDSQTNQTSCMIDFTDSFFVDANETKYLQLTWDVADNDYFNSSDKTYHVELLSLTSTSFRYTDNGEYVDTASIAPNEGFVGNDQTVLSPELRISLSGLVSNSTVLTSQTDVDGVSFQFDNMYEHGTPLIVKNIKIQGYVDSDTNGLFSEGTDGSVQLQDIIQNVKLMYGSTQIGTTQNVASDGTISFNNLDWTIPTNTGVIMKLVFDVSSSAPEGGNSNRVAFDIKNASTDVLAEDEDSNSVRATGDATNGGTNPTVFVTINNAETQTSLSVTKNDITPDSNIILTGTNNLQLATFDLSATGESIKLERLGLDLSDDELREAINQVYINDGEGNKVATSIDNNQATFTNLAWTITPGTDKSFSVYVNLNSMNDDGAYSGKRVQIKVNDDVMLRFIGLDSGTVGTVFANHVDGGAEAEGNTMVVHKSKPIISSTTLTNNVLEAGEKEVYKFGLNANNGDYEFGKFILKYAKTGNYNIDSCNVYRDAVIAANGIISTDKISFTFNSSQIISTVPTYIVKCTFSGTFSNNDAFDTFINTDTDYIANNTFQNIAATDANIVWSDLGDSNHLDIGNNSTSSDFTNGYLLESLDHQVLVYTSSEPAAPTVDLKANGSDGPVTINSGDNITMNWTITNATSCTASSSWSGSKNSSGGEETINNVTTDGTYTLQCTGDGGTASDSVTVNVEQTPAPTVDLKANDSDGPVTIDSGDNISLNWTITNATSCTASGSWSGSKNSSGGEETINNVTTDGTYTLQCTGDGGTASDSVTVNVQEAVNTDAGIIFIRGGNIYKISLDGTNEIQLTSGGTDSSPRVSGNVVYFSRTRSGGSHNIWKMKTDGTEVTKLTDDGGNDTDPLLGDGKVFFKSNRVADKDYYYMNTDGGTITAFDPKNNFYFAHIGLGYHNGSEHLVTVSTATWYNLYRYNNLFDVNYLTNTKVGSDYSGTAGASSFIWTSSGNTMIMSCSVDDACGTGGNIYTYNKNDGSKSHIVAGSSPSFSSSEDRIIFVNSSGHISLIGLDGTNEVDLGVSGTNPQYSAL